MNQQTSACSSCGAVLPQGARFCTECGTQVGSEASVAGLNTMSNLETVMPTTAYYPDDQPVEAGQTLNPGDVIAGKFQIDRVIGQGGMGVVYKAAETVSGQTAAVKVIGKKYLGSEAAIKRLIDEGVVTRSISHANVVQIYDIGLHGTQPYIAMEYLEGRPLHVWRGEKMANDETVSVRVAAQIIKEVLIGLEAAHEAGVIHRDLKPENIMLLEEPSATKARVKIVDFGIALATKTATASGTGTGLGTQLYMAPEQIRNANAANASADLYSVSKIFYELIVGVLPTGHWQPPSGGRSDVPAGIDELISTGLSANRDMRPQSASAYKKLLIEAMNGKRVGPDPIKPDPAKPKFKTGWIWAGAIGFIILLAVLLDPETWDDGGYEGPDYYASKTVETTPTSTASTREAELTAEPEPAREATPAKTRVSVPAPSQPSYQYYSGVWTDNYGTYYQVQFGPDWQFSGNGITPDGTPLTIMGEVSGDALSYTIGLNGQIIAAGQGRKADKCHFDVRTNLYLTGEIADAKLHVNHEGSAPCP